MPNILDTIVTQKRVEVSRLPKSEINAEVLLKALEDRNDTRDFLSALTKPRRGETALIAEVKKASPSAGIIRQNFNPVEIAKEYEENGATCLSVLTDETFFQGKLEFLKNIRANVKVPLLRKDFIIDPRQILESIEWGADAILLIAAILDDSMLHKLHELAVRAGLTALVEVHNLEELERVLGIEAKLIGVNNRNLKNFKVDLATTEKLAERIFAKNDPAPKSPILVGESGIHTRSDVVRLKKVGASAVLVGESLMRHPDMAAKIRELLGG